MGRPKTIRSIDAKIEAVKGKIQKAKKRYDNRAYPITADLSSTFSSL